MADLVILLSAAGRRPYLVRWFKQALQNNGLSGEVILADADPLAAAQSQADRVVVAPYVSDPLYEEWLRDVVSRFKVDLALSVNDFELSSWARMVDPPAALLHLDHQIQQHVEDKYLMALHLGNMGVHVPPTHLIKELGDISAALKPRQPIILKQRFGSGSRGLQRTTPEQLVNHLPNARKNVYGPSGEQALLEDADDYLVVQPEIDGVEFGMDVISDLNAKHSAVLVRRKISMRAGETDKAVTVQASSFEQIARDISNAIPHRGIIDVDVILDDERTMWVIDINPRFGGGYPFSHNSGADVPSAYIAWLLNRNPKTAWLVGRAGITSSKYVDLTVVTGNT